MTHSPDTLSISGLRCYGYSGYLPEEQVLGQWFDVTLDIATDLKTAGSSDRLTDTLDYGPLVESIRELVRTQRFALIERLAEAISSLVMACGGVSSVRVRLTKLNPPIPDFHGSITIDITRP